MSNNLWFGNSCVYVGAVNDVTALCESAVEEAGYTARELSDEVTSCLEEVVNMKEFLDNPTNSIIFATLHSACCMLEDKFEELGIQVKVDYYVNCDDSHLYIDNEDYHDGEGTIREIIANLKSTMNEKLIKAMETAGYYYDDINSGDNYYQFDGEYGHIYFESPKEIEEWLDGVVFDDPEISVEVEKIMHPERFN